MRREVTVVFDAGQRIDIPLGSEDLPTFDEARSWLDAQFVQHGCEPVRGSGKVLTADKVLAVAAALGPQGLAQPPLALAFARATAGALGKTALTVNVAEHALSY